MTTTAPALDNAAPPAEPLVVYDGPAFVDTLAELAPAPALERVDAALAATRARQLEVTRELTRPSRDFTRLSALREEFGQLDAALVELEHERRALALAVEGERQRERQRHLAVAEARAVYEGLLAGLSDPELSEIPIWAYPLFSPDRARQLVRALQKRMASDRERLRALGVDVPPKLTIKL